MESTGYDFDKNELAELSTLTQIIEVETSNLSESETKEVESHIHGYIQNALNDNLSKDGDEQIPFYDARLNIETQANTKKRIYTINFHILSVECWTDAVKAKLKNSYLKPLQSKVTSAKLVSETVVKSLKAFKRDPTSYEDLTNDESPGCSNISGDNCWEKFLNYWLVVPRVQWDFFDLLYQMYTFDIFHQGVIPKFVHFFTIPTNVMLSMMFLAQFNLPSLGEVRYGNAFAVNFALLLFFVLGLAYIIMGILRKSWAWGVATCVVLGVLNMTGNLWFYSYRTKGNPWYNPTNLYTHPFIWSYVISAIQALSHMIVPQMPPNITGVQHWESMHMYFMMKRKDTVSTIKHICFVILSVLLFPILSVAVAWFSWPHLIGTEVIYIMAGIGYRPQFFENYFRIVEKVELFGNPIINTFPTNHKDISNKLPAHVKAMKKTGIISPHASDGEILASIATLKLASIYLRRGVKESNVKKRKTNQTDDVEMGSSNLTSRVNAESKHLDVLLATRKGFIGKCNKSK